ncbi:MAG: hypothetical protein IPM54_19905 [Polyangiaceae bacterium]|nr:hypothetical protein [Polyangiaceae bacterium]
MNDDLARPSPNHVVLASQRLTYEPPDTVLWVIRGDLDGGEAAVAMDQFVDWSRGQPYMLFVVDVVELTAFSGEARKVLASNGHRLPPRVLSFFGASFKVQVLLDMMDRATALRGSKNRFTRHFPDEPSARAWAAEMRPVLLEKAAAAVQ